MHYAACMADSEIVIVACPEENRVEAVRLLNEGLTADQQAALPAALNSVRHQDEDAFAGLFVALQQESLVGSTWVQLTPGRTAVVWPPERSGLAARRLMQRAAEFIASRNLPLAQILVAAEATQDAELFAAGGFNPLVDLVYLAIENSQFATAQSDSQLDFIAGAGNDPQRLGQLLVDTYRQTLDCPEINGLRTAEDILASYTAQGDYDPNRWYFLQHAGADVGVLLLTEYRGTGTWELIYMGVIPAARGNRFGRQVLRFAIDAARLGGAERLVLAADERNAPALALYRAAGMVSWDRRRVYARIDRQSTKSE